MHYCALHCALHLANQAMLVGVREAQRLAGSGFINTRQPQARLALTRATRRRHALRFSFRLSFGLPFGFPFRLLFHPLFCRESTH
jgi:hypothetical protein